MDTEEQREEEEQDKSDMYISLIHIVEKTKSLFIFQINNILMTGKPTFV
jgi:hypothetical protein